MVYVFECAGEGATYILTSSPGETVTFVRGAGQRIKLRISSNLIKFIYHTDTHEEKLKSLLSSITVLN